MAGANVTMTTSELLKQDANPRPVPRDPGSECKPGWKHMSTNSVTANAWQHEPEGGGRASAFERANYMKVLSSFKQLP